MKSLTIVQHAGRNEKDPIRAFVFVSGEKKAHILVSRPRTGKTGRFAGLPLHFHRVKADWWIYLHPLQRLKLLPHQVQ